MVALLVLFLMMVHYVSTGRVDTPLRKNFKNDRTDPYKHKYYHRSRQLKPGGGAKNKGGGGRSNKNSVK